MGSDSLLERSESEKLETKAVINTLPCCDTFINFIAETDKSSLMRLLEKTQHEETL